ncbi:MAG: hypothetical protein ACREDE_05115 [Thermoplasmata archaeon]
MSRIDRVSELFPLPFVGVALLLAVLIVLTPVLTAYGQPVAGSLLSQADLIVDAQPGNNSTHYYVRGVSVIARYSEIRIAVAFGFNWTGSFPTGRLNWTGWQNASSSLGVSQSVDESPVAINVSALYSANGVSALYVGLFAVEVGVLPGSSADILTVISDTPGISSFTYAVSLLPLPIPLANLGSGSGP